MNKIIKCNKCGGLMIQGFAMTLPAGRLAVNCWVEGIIERSIWRGILFAGKRRHPITTFGVVKAGYWNRSLNVASKE